MRFARQLEVMAAVALSVLALLPATARAADGKTVSLELNKAATTKDGCLLTFVASNGTGGALASAGFEFVLFDKDGLVDRMTVFDFGALPEDKTVVRQFQIGNAPCEGIGSILVNGASGCTADAASQLCAATLATASRTPISFNK